MLGFRKRKSKSWISPKSWKEVEERRQLKQKLAGTRSERLRAKLQQEYRKKDLEVKRSLRKDKNLAQEAEHAAKHGQMKGVCDATRKLCSEPPKKIDIIRQDVDTRRGGAKEVEGTLRGSTEQAQPRTSGRCD